MGIHSLVFRANHSFFESERVIHSFKRVTIAKEQKSGRAKKQKSKFPTPGEGAEAFPSFRSTLSSDHHLMLPNPLANVISLNICINRDQLVVVASCQLTVLPY